MSRNHASNAYMLHALGITHVVSVGECALVPPQHLNNSHGNTHSLQTSHPNSGHFVPGKGHGGQGSLWTEEREGRIKVLDIKGICDDGIDTLEPQLEPICEWIDRARAEGGRVLVHCRVGVSRSATVVVSSCILLPVTPSDFDPLDRLCDEAPLSSFGRRVPHCAVKEVERPHSAKHATTL